MEIISKRHPYKFYLTLILVNLFFFSIGTLLLIESIKGSNNKFSLLSLVFICIPIVLNFGFIKNAGKIILSKKGIIFKNNSFSWDDLSSAKLTGKGQLFFTPAECATLTFKDLKSIRIFDDIYSNSSEMKYFIQEIVIDKKDTIEILKRNIHLTDIDREFSIPFKGNPVFSFRGILMWGLILFFILLPFFSKKPINLLGLLFLIFSNIFWFTMSSWMMHYFEVSKNFFIAKNHYFFWIKKVYPLNEIKEIVFEQQYKQPNRLRIITKDFKTKFYLAGSLTDKTWLEMKKELEEKNIEVRNECI